MPSLTLERFCTVAIAVYFSALLLFLATRHVNEIIPVWYLTISAKKLVIMIVVSGLLTLAAVWIIRSRAVLSALIIANIALPLLAHGDFFVLRFAPLTEVKLVARANPYLESIDDIRRIKRGSRNYDELWLRLFETYLKDIKSDQERAVHAMLIVAGFYHFGNISPKHQAKTGCVAINEDTGFRTINPTFEAFKESRIGCCSDYSMLLASFLSWMSIENKPVFIPGHVANKMAIGHEWRYLDASTTLIVDGLIGKPNRPITITYFLPPNDTYRFQNWLIRAISDEAHFVVRALR